MPRFRVWILATFIMGLGACISTSSAPVLSLADGRSGRIWFTSRTMRFPTFLQGGDSAPEAAQQAALDVRDTLATLLIPP